MENCPQGMQCIGTTPVYVNSIPSQVYSYKVWRPYQFGDGTDDTCIM